MKVVRNNIYEGCYEVRVYPFAEPDADMRQIISDGYFRVLIERDCQPRIETNCQLGHMTTFEVLQLQTALNKLVEVSLRGEYRD